MTAIGATVGGYLLTGALGRGGMGMVYRARHNLLGRDAAVKVLRPELSRDQVVVGRFFNEARAASAIRHPGIVEIYDFGFDEAGLAYIVMELLDGEALATRIAAGRRPLAAWWPIVRSIAVALGAAHARGIVHRDLKPDNVFLVADGEVAGGERAKLLDFGVAKLAPERGAAVTQTGALIGTPTYMAPEQCRGVAVDHRADLYALGCIVFELCAGAPPFVGEGFGDLLAAHIHQAPPDLATRGVPAPVAALVARLLAKDPAARPASADEVVHAIDALAGDARVATAPPSALAFAPTVAMPTTLGAAAGAMPPPPRRGWLIGAVVGGLVLASGAALWPRGVGGAANEVGRSVAVDAGAIDAGAIDGGAIDAGAIDGGAIDAGVVDGGAVDAGAPSDASPRPRPPRAGPNPNQRRLPLRPTAPGPRPSSPTPAPVPAPDRGLNPFTPRTR
ncbi:MAG: serine/threonine-protein kinase [Kofleriaceae bacterium]